MSLSQWCHLTISHPLLPLIFLNISVSWVTDTLTLALMRDLGEVSSFSAWLQGTSISIHFSINRSSLTEDRNGTQRQSNQAVMEIFKVTRWTSLKAKKRIPKKSSERNNGLCLLQTMFPMEKLRSGNLLELFVSCLCCTPFSSYTIHVFNFTLVWKCRGKAHNLYGSPHSC